MKESSEKLFEKAERAIQATRTLLDAGDTEFAAGRAYYAMFYVAKALVEEKGFNPKKHGSVHGAFGELFAKPGLIDPKFHRWLLDAFDTRIRTDYGLDVGLDREAVDDLLLKATEFLEAARRYLGVGED